MERMHAMYICATPAVYRTESFFDDWMVENAIRCNDESQRSIFYGAE